jgi:hypothetical protein
VITKIEIHNRKRGNFYVGGFSRYCEYGSEVYFKEKYNLTGKVIK